MILLHAGDIAVTGIADRALAPAGSIPVGTEAVSAVRPACETDPLPSANVNSVEGGSPQQQTCGTSISGVKCPVQVGCAL